MILLIKSITLGLRRDYENEITFPTGLNYVNYEHYLFFWGIVCDCLLSSLFLSSHKKIKKVFGYAISDVINVMCDRFVKKNVIDVITSTRNVIYSVKAKRNKRNFSSEKRNLLREVTLTINSGDKK